MYKFKNTNLLIPVFLLLSTQIYTLSAFSFRNIFEDMDHTFKNMRQELKTRFKKQDKLNPEDQNLVNKQLDIVSKIKPVITKNEIGVITIAFPIDNIDKGKIELFLENGLLNGILPLDNGYFKFIVNSNFVRCEYIIELNKEILHEYPITYSEKSDKTDKQTEQEEKVAHSHTISWKTSNYFTETLPLEVEPSKSQSETKNNTLFIKLEPKSYTRLQIKHA